jgi:hypothetical protein
MGIRVWKQKRRNERRIKMQRFSTTHAALYVYEMIAFWIFVLLALVLAYFGVIKSFAGDIFCLRDAHMLGFNGLWMVKCEIFKLAEKVIEIEIFFLLRLCLEQKLRLCLMCIKLKNHFHNYSSSPQSKAKVQKIFFKIFLSLCNNNLEAFLI